MKNKIVVFMVTLFTLILVTGCWDRREIETLGLVVGIGVDKGENSSGFELTQQFINTIIGGRNGVAQAYYNVTTSGSNILKMIQDTSKQQARSPYFTHLKVILISDEIASSIAMPDLINFFTSEHEMRRTVQVLVVDGSAKEALNVKIKNREVPSLALLGMMHNDYKTSEMPPSVTLGDISIRTSSNESFLVQYIQKGKEGVNLNGAAVFSGARKKFIGRLSAEETMGVNLLKGTREGSKGGVLTVRFTEGKSLNYEIRRVRTRIEPVVTRDKVAFRVSIKSEGRLGENWTGMDAMEKEDLDKINHLVVQEMERIVEKALAKIQKVYKTDVIGFGERLKIHHYKRWKTIKGDWDNVFSKADITVQANVKIQEYGAKGRRMPKKK